jgi:hypothetical protein
MRLNNMEKSMISKEKHFRKEAEEAKKISNDDVFVTNEVQKKELEMAKERGDAVVKLKHKREQLEMERERIMDNLENIRHGNKYGRPRTGLSNAGADIINPNDSFHNRPELDPALKDKLIADQVKLNHLYEERQKTKDLGYNMDMDEIDKLEREVDHYVKPPQTAKDPTLPSAPISFPNKKNDVLKDFNQTVPHQGVTNPQLLSGKENIFIIKNYCNKKRRFKLHYLIIMSYR